MLGKNDLVSFVATADKAAARRFYEQVLGLRLVEDSPFALVFDANGAMLRVTPVPEHKTLPFTVLGWKVSDIAVTVRGLAAKGVNFDRFPGMTQDALGIWTTPDGAKVAWFKDSDGNLLSLTEFAAPR